MEDKDCQKNSPKFIHLYLNSTSIEDIILIKKYAKLSGILAKEGAHWELKMEKRCIVYLHLFIIKGYKKLFLTYIIVNALNFTNFSQCFNYNQEDINLLYLI